MWIRSQCKSLLIYTTEIFLSSPSGSVIQCYSKESGTRYNLGTYKTEEDALKILDDMQSPLAKFKYVGVYIMPQE